MRDWREIGFRVKQEGANLRMALRAPRLPSSAAGSPAPLAGLPDPAPAAAALRGTAFAGEVLDVAASIVRHRFPVLGTHVETGPAVCWRRDYAQGIESGKPYFRRVPYLDARQAGDHKLVWELNRHQHLVLLAQAFRFSGERDYLREIGSQWQSWREDNPWLRGINWASALEVAFRALSWVWVYHLAGHEFDAPLQRAWLEELYRHGCYLEHNLSVYFSPNTHLLGEAVALHALGALFPEWPRASRWQRLGGGMTARQMAAQVRADGSHFEQSTYYHVYALDFFLFHALLAETTPEYRAGLARMAEYLEAVAGPDRKLPLFGDDDGGRLFHPYGPRDRFARATLASCGAWLERPEWIGAREDLFPQAAWWMGKPALEARLAGPAALASRLFSDAGMAVMCGGGWHVVADAGPFGPWSAGHSHSDTLHLVARAGGQDLLLDPGTYTYIGDPSWRERFRGSAAHNTVRVDGADQAAPAGPFAWSGKPVVRILGWQSGPAFDWLDARWQSGGITHRRRFLLLKPGPLLILDEVEGPPGSHTVEQFWHFGAPAKLIAGQVVRIGERAALALAPEAAVSMESGWRSEALGHKTPAPVARACYTGGLPARLAALLDPCGHAGIALRLEDRRLHFEASTSRGTVDYPAEGRPYLTLVP